jgi:hypothetical protein
MSDEDDCVNPFRNLRKRLTEILHEVDDMLHTIQAEEPLYKRVFPVRKEFCKVLGMKSGSLSDILQTFLPKWKSEGRIGKGGRMILIGKEGKKLGLPVDKEVDVYVLCNSMLQMLETD